MYVCVYIYRLHRTFLAPPLPGVTVRVNGDPLYLLTPDCLVDFTGAGGGGRCAGSLSGSFPNAGGGLNAQRGDIHSGGAGGSVVHSGGIAIHSGGAGGSVVHSGGAGSVGFSCEESGLGAQRGEGRMGFHSGGAGGSALHSGGAGFSCEESGGGSPATPPGFASSPSASYSSYPPSASFSTHTTLASPSDRPHQHRTGSHRLSSPPVLYSSYSPSASLSTHTTLVSPADQPHPHRLSSPPVLSANSQRLVVRGFDAPPTVYHRPAASPPPVSPHPALSNSGLIYSGYEAGPSTAGSPFCFSGGGGPPRYGSPLPPFCLDENSHGDIGGGEGARGSCDTGGGQGADTGGVPELPLELWLQVRRPQLSLYTISPIPILYGV